MSVSIGGGKGWLGGLGSCRWKTSWRLEEGVGLVWVRNSRVVDGCWPHAGETTPMARLGRRWPHADEHWGRDRPGSLGSSGGEHRQQVYCVRGSCFQASEKFPASKILGLILTQLAVSIARQGSLDTCWQGVSAGSWARVGEKRRERASGASGSAVKDPGNASRQVDACKLHPEG